MVTSHEIQRRLLLGRKVMTNLESILKGRDNTLSRKVHLVKAIVLPVVMYGCESWTIKKAEHWRMDAFELWCWRRLLRVLGLKEIQPVHPKGNQTLNIHWKDQCWSWSSNTLASWFWRADSLEKNLMLGTIEGSWTRGQRIRWLDVTSDSMDRSLSKFWELVIVREVWRDAVHGVTKSWTWLNNWTN